MLTCFYISLLILGGGYIALTFLVGELLDFGEDVGQAIEGVSDSVGEALGSLGDALEVVLGGAEAADVGGMDLPKDVRTARPIPTTTGRQREILRQSPIGVEGSPSSSSSTAFSTRENAVRSSETNTFCLAAFIGTSGGLATIFLPPRRKPFMIN